MKFSCFSFVKAITNGVHLHFPYEKWRWFSFGGFSWLNKLFNNNIFYVAYNICTADDYYDLKQNFEIKNLWMQQHKFSCHLTAYIAYIILILMLHAKQTDRLEMKVCARLQHNWRNNAWHVFWVIFFFFDYFVVVINHSQMKGIKTEKRKTMSVTFWFINACIYSEHQKKVHIKKH